MPSDKPDINTCALVDNQGPYKDVAKKSIVSSNCKGLDRKDDVQDRNKDLELKATPSAFQISILALPPVPRTHASMRGGFEEKCPSEDSMSTP